MATVCNAAVNIGVQIPVQAPPVTFGCKPRSRTAGYFNSVFKVLRDHCTVFHCNTLSFTSLSVPCLLRSKPCCIAQGQATAACITEPELGPSVGPSSRAEPGLQGSLAICFRPSGSQLYKNSCLSLDRTSVRCVTYQGGNPTWLSWNCQPRLWSLRASCQSVKVQGIAQRRPLPLGPTKSINISVLTCSPHCVLSLMVFGTFQGGGRWCAVNDPSLFSWILNDL